MAALEGANIPGSPPVAKLTGKKTPTSPLDVVADLPGVKTKEEEEEQAARRRRRKALTKTPKWMRIPETRVVTANIHGVEPEMEANERNRLGETLALAETKALAETAAVESQKAAARGEQLTLLKPLLAELEENKRRVDVAERRAEQVTKAARAVCRAEMEERSELLVEIKKAHEAAAEAEAWREVNSSRT